MDKLVLILNNWLDDPRFDYSNGLYFKSMEKFLNVENVFLRKTKISLCIFVFKFKRGLIKCWWKWTIEEQYKR